MQSTHITDVIEVLGTEWIHLGLGYLNPSQFLPNERHKGMGCSRYAQCPLLIFWFLEHQTFHTPFFTHAISTDLLISTAYSLFVLLN